MILAVAPGALSARDQAPLEYLDEQTAATITVVSQPLIFAYARRELAANARDYATLAAAAVNRGGRVNYVVIVYFWSTVDPRLRQGTPATESLILEADDRRIGLKLQGHSPRDAGIGIPIHAPPGDATQPNVYGAELPTLRFIAESRHLGLQVESEGTTFTYDLWEDRRGALRGFVRHMNGSD